jgi:hypothetical protein
VCAPDQPAPRPNQSIGKHSKPTAIKFSFKRHFYTMMADVFPFAPRLLVTNIASQAVPVSLSGTTVPGAVSATQSGTWNVGITGTPSVNVGNSASSPVLVRDVDNPVRSPYTDLASAATTCPYCDSGISSAT